MSTVAPDCRRLFFALWPDELVRQQIESTLLAQPQRNATPRAHWHMTLVFLGMTSRQQQSCLEKAATSVKARSFHLQLDTTGYFPHARVAWLGCRQYNQALQDFQGALEQALRNACPSHTAFDRPSHSFCPHVTLYRHVDSFPAVSAFPEIEVESTSIKWPVRSFSLIESRRTGQPVYRTLNRWGLISDDASM